MSTLTNTSKNVDINAPVGSIMEIIIHARWNGHTSRTQHETHIVGNTNYTLPFVINPIIVGS